MKSKNSLSKFYYKGEYFVRPTRDSIKESLGKIRVGNKNMIKIKVENIYDGNIFESLTLACKFYGFNYNTERNRMVKNMITSKFRIIKT